MNTQSETRILDFIPVNEMMIIPDFFMRDSPQRFSLDDWASYKVFIFWLSSKYSFTYKYS